MYKHLAAMRSTFSGDKVFHLNKVNVFLLKCLGFLFAIVLFMEFLLYYVVIGQCSWPDIKGVADHNTGSTLRVMFLADTHLLGEIRGHWFDKLRREWQMERSYQAALWLLQPNLVFILGDLFDEGKWSRTKAWDDDVARFKKMFRHPPHTELMVAVGNHDIGFHYEMTLHKLKRFEKAFNITSGKLVSRNGINFVVVNSVALEGDNCVICREEEEQLLRISHRLNCSRMQKHADFSKRCRNVRPVSATSPILLQHYPLYRKSDAECTGEDAASPEEKKVQFKEKYDVLSHNASEKLLNLLQPRLILSGHTHSACEVLHRGEIPEISVPSFSCRNRKDPSFIMGSFTADDFSLAKCFLPTENTIINVYSMGIVLLMIYVAAYIWQVTYGRKFLAKKHKPG
ncbi:metallophosphoesterase 1 [Bombina bombina]|uniref:metallophosphoesterase 1 n=1 Tax=Bombina bombina TaxID=8345 RepID=UPI00235A6D4B|nr:metallophosphoesterase 1 [Bombina bombina]XP_053570886.1 metallophosphoesterase 1 [Bombina bombina]